MDHIVIRDLQVPVTIGVYDWEKTAPQVIVVDVDMRVDLTEAAASDLVSDTVDYAAVATRVLEIGAQQQFDLLEAFVGAMIRGILAQFSRVQQVEILVSKSGCIPGARVAQVRMCRGR